MASAPYIYPGSYPSQCTTPAKQLISVPNLLHRIQSTQVLFGVILSVLCAREFTTSQYCLLPQLSVADGRKCLEWFPGPWDHKCPGPWQCFLSKEAWLAESILSKAKTMPLPSRGPLWLGNVDSSASPGPKQDCLAGLCGLSIN